MGHSSFKPELFGSRAHYASLPLVDMTGGILRSLSAPKGSERRKDSGVWKVPGRDCRDPGQWDQSLATNSQGSRAAGIQKGWLPAEQLQMPGSSVNPEKQGM